MTCYYPDLGSASDWQRFCLSDWLKQISHAARPKIKKKKILSLRVNAFSTKVLIGDTIFTPFYVVIQATRRSSHLQSKDSTFISQLFLDPEY